MERQLAERSNQLQGVLSQSHSVQDSMDSLLAWLEQAEKATNRVINAPIIVRKDALLELLQDYKVLCSIDQSNMFYQNFPGIVLLFNYLL